MRRVLLAAALAGIMVVLSACGGSVPQPSQADNQPSETSNDGQTPTPPTRADDITETTPGDPYRPDGTMSPEEVQARRDASKVEGFNVTEQPQEGVPECAWKGRLWVGYYPKTDNYADADNSAFVFKAKRGDTITKLSEECETTVEHMMRKNVTVNHPDEVLPTGMAIGISPDAPPKDPPPSTTTSPSTVPPATPPKGLA